MVAISFVTIIKNRTRFTVEHEGAKLELRLFENNLRALIRLVQPTDKWEFIIVDFGSTDVDLASWVTTLGAPPNMTFRVIPAEGPFNKGRGLNIAIPLISHGIVFFMDADMEIRTRALFDDIRTVVQRGRKVLFPICWSYSNPAHTEGWKRDWGVGNVIQPTDTVRPYVEKDSWGKEDWWNFCWYRDRGLAVRTYYGEGFVHQWHPNDLEFKNQYYACTEEAAKLDQTGLAPHPYTYANHEHNSRGSAP